MKLIVLLLKNIKLYLKGYKNIKNMLYLSRR